MEPVTTIIIESNPKAEKTDNTNIELSTTCKNIIYPFWLVWTTITTVICCPVLLCTFMGQCERSSGGYPTYPSCLADLQCCTVMCCKCERGY